jgi:hypothetical protein
MMIHQVDSMEMDSGVKVCMLFALSVLSILGLRYPLQMLPVLFWEFTWKASWLLAVALPHWRRGAMEPGSRREHIRHRDDRDFYSARPLVVCLRALCEEVG